MFKYGYLNYSLGGVRDIPARHVGFNLKKLPREQTFRSGCVVIMSTMISGILF